MGHARKKTANRENTSILFVGFRVFCERKNRLDLGKMASDREIKNTIGTRQSENRRYALIGSRKERENEKYCGFIGEGLWRKDPRKNSI